MKFTRGLSIAVIVAMTAIGCSSDDDDAAETTSTTTSAAATSATSATTAAESAATSASTSAGAETSSAAAETSTAAAPARDYKGKTLTVWHYEDPAQGSAMGLAWAEAMKQFEAKYPGSKVKFELKTFDQIRQNAPMIFNSDSAPDVAEYNKGNASAGLLSKQGLLSDLTEQATQYGWDKKLSPSLQTTSKYDESGTMGAGKWFGVPNYGEYVMVYYNKDMFEKQGVQVPTTLEEFTAVLDKFKAAGITPIANSGADYPAQQIWYSLALSKADRTFVDNYELYKSKVDFKGPEMMFGATTYADWVKKGYIAKTSATTKADDMALQFTTGKSPILISGSWWYGTFAKQVKNFQWGTFLFPGNTLHPGSGGNIWVVPSKSKNKDMAADFIDITMSPEIQNLLGNGGGVPIAADPAAITDPKNKELIDNFNKLLDEDGLAFYPDWPVPGYYDTLVAGVQQLTNGSKNPEQFLDSIAKPYNDNLAKLGK